MKNLTLLLLFLLPVISSAYTLGPTTPGKWGDPTLGTGATISYSFMGGGQYCDQSICLSLSSFMPTGYKSEIERAFDAWSSVANLTFIEISDDNLNSNHAATTSGDIRFAGEYFDGAGGRLAHAFFPPNNGLSIAGDIHFDTSEEWKIGFGGADTISSRSQHMK